MAGCGRNAGNNPTYSPRPMSPPPTTPIGINDLASELTAQRPELAQEWTQQGTLERHLQRLKANAHWLLERYEHSNRPSISTLRRTGQLRPFCIDQAISLATRDDLYDENTFDRNPDVETLNETQLRSGWF
jgi:hypothetical protein